MKSAVFCEKGDAPPLAGEDEVKVLARDAERVGVRADAREPVKRVVAFLFHNFGRNA